MARILVWGASLVVCGLAPSAWAQPRAVPVDELIVTGTRAAEGVDRDRIGSSVTVITAQDIEARQVRLISDVLRDVPGFAVSRTGGVGGFTQVRVRGSEANHVLTLIDGIEASDPFFGEFDYATLLADDVARVEILRGAQSALYGSDAIAGVVNYITPSGREAPGGRLRAEVGSDNTIGGSARYGGVVGDLDYVLNAGFQKTDGYVGQTLPGGVREVGSNLKSLSAKANYQVSDQLRLRAVVRHTDTHAQSTASSFGRGQVDAFGSYFDAISLYGFLGADLSLMDGRWTHSLSAQGVDAERDSYSGQVRSGGDEGRREKASYATSYRFSGGGLTHRITGAADWERETFQNTSPPRVGANGDRRSIENKGLVGQYDLEIGDVAGAGLALRHDDNDRFGDATTYRVQGFYRFGEALRIRAAAGSGIKNPTQTELFGFNATGPFPFTGNEQLSPERSEGWEAGVDFSFADGRFRLGATYFDAELEDEIFSASRTTAIALGRADCPVPALGFSTSCNRTFRSKQAGVELFGEARLIDDVALSASYTDLDAKENGLEEVRRAPNIGAANLTWTPLDGRGTVNLNLRYNGRQLDSNFTGLNPPLPAGLPNVAVGTGVNAGRVILPAFTLLNLSASFKVVDDVEIFGRVENLTDEAYYEVFGYPTPGRKAYVGARISF